MIGLLILTELGLLGSQYRDVGPVPLEQPTDESTLRQGVPPSLGLRHPCRWAGQSGRAAGCSALRRHRASG
jgi:hypothetical protein